MLDSFFTQTGMATRREYMSKTLEVFSFDNAFFSTRKEHLQLTSTFLFLGHLHTTFLGSTIQHFCIY